MSVYITAPQPVEDAESGGLPDSLRRKTRKTESAKFLVGWREWLALPDLGIPGIKAKVDTGARTSALHTHDYEMFRRGGKEWVRFHLHPLRHNEEVQISCEAEVTDVREVRDSGGHAETRPFIETTARIGKFEWPLALSLTNRESMKFRMLLGRRALAGYFLVDSFGSYLMGKDLTKKYRL